MKKRRTQRKVIAFLFVGSIDQIGDELAKAVKKLGLKPVIRELIKHADRAAAESARRPPGSIPGHFRSGR